MDVFDAVFVLGVAGMCVVGAQQLTSSLFKSIDGEFNDFWAALACAMYGMHCMHKDKATCCHICACSKHAPALLLLITMDLYLPIQPS